VIGRPTRKTPELLKEICARISEGRSLSSVCRDEDMPNHSVTWRWLAEDSSFQEDYARAIQARAMAHADRVLDVTEAVLRGEIPSDAARVALDGMKWTASRLLPKVYGDRTQVEATVTHTHTLHLEALKALAGKGSGYIEGQATEIPALPTFGGERLGGSDRALEGAEAVGQAVDRPDPPGTPDRPGAPACAPPAPSTHSAPEVLPPTPPPARKRPRVAKNRKDVTE
jgi:hypothetical protein